MIKELTSATDVVRMRAALRTFLVDEPDTPDGIPPLEFGIRRIMAQCSLNGLTDAAIRQVAPFIVGNVGEDSPEHMAANYFVARELGPSIMGIADALPDDTTHASAPPPSERGFAVLGAPLTWDDQYGLEHRVDTITWGPMVMKFENADDPAAEPLAYRGPLVALWTAHSPDQNWRYQREQAVDSTSHRAFLWGSRCWGRKLSWGWHLQKLVSPFPEFAVGSPMLPLTEVAPGDSHALPIVNDGVANLDRIIHALFLVLAGAHHVPGSTRDPQPVAETPNRTRVKLARKHRGTPQVSMIYAGVERPPTPRENVGTRGPIGVRYWRSGFTKLVTLPDGRQVVRKRRGSWVNAHKPELPLSTRTKVRIAQGTVVRPSDVMREETVS